MTQRIQLYLDGSVGRSGSPLLNVAIIPGHRRMIEEFCL
jgi:hypothetical protein